MMQSYLDIKKDSLQYVGNIRWTKTRSRKIGEAVGENQVGGNKGLK